MNTEKTVFSKLFKSESVELGSHNVELGSIKEVNKAISVLKNVEKSAQKVADKHDANMNVATKSYNALLSERNAIHSWAYSNAPAIISDFEKSAKELGISADNVSEIKELKKLIQLGKELVGALDDYKRPKSF